MTLEIVIGLVSSRFPRQGGMAKAEGRLAP